GVDWAWPSPESASSRMTAAAPTNARRVRVSWRPTGVSMRRPSWSPGAGHLRPRPADPRPARGSEGTLPEAPPRAQGAVADPGTPENGGRGGQEAETEPACWNG